MKEILLNILRDFKTKQEILDILYKEYNIDIDERALRGIIRDMVMAGYPIISECRSKIRGYKLEMDINKLKEAEAKLRHRGIAILQRAEKLKEYRERYLMKGQLTLI